jgi:AraC-like DNA-binding protein
MFSFFASMPKHDLTFCLRSQFLDRHQANQEHFPSLRLNIIIVFVVYKRGRVETMLASVHMSTSAFHHHFRVLTAMSPLQYQKWLRLNEARRLMLTEHLNPATAAFQVGYESPSQFSREYRRLFDEPPLRDITYLRQMADSVRAYGSSQLV